MFIFEEKFRKLSYRSENTFLSPENREKRHFSKLFQFWVLHTPGWNLNVYWSKVLNSLYIRIELFLKGCCTFRDIWLFSFKKWPDFWEIREKRRFLNFRPPPLLIFVNENAHWYQYVALCKLVWMHCVHFFRGELLQRYRQITAENRHLNTRYTKADSFTIE